MNEASAFWRLLARNGGGARAACGALVALAAHAGLVVLARAWTPASPPLVAVTEIDLLPPPPPPAPELPTEPPPPAAQPLAPARTRARAPAAPAPARAGALRTAEESAKTTSEPVRFVTDPNGAAYGFGTVARGGTADAAPTGAALGGGTAPAAQPGPAPILSRPPRLAEGDPCRGYFPSRARVDQGEVALRVRVERDGSVRAISVSRESPLGHGFGFAARDCLLAKRFSPALDRDGREVAVTSPVTVRFSR